MDARLFGPAILSLAMSGCATRPQIPVSPPSPPPTATPNFDHFSIANRPYRMLIERGVRPDDIDRGCHQIDRRQPEAREEIRFANDHQLEPCEVEEFVLDRYEKYPDIAKVLIGGQIPWVIYDPLIRKRIQGAIQAIEEDLRASSLSGQSGLVPGSDDYLKRKALGLYSFAMFPSDPSVVRQDSTRRERLRSDFQPLGFKKLEDDLLAHGGLGLSEITEDAVVEATADETLRDKKGWCTEKSKVLFAVYRMARLEPSFMFAKVEDVLEAFPDLRSASLNTSKYDGHAYLRVPLKTKVFYVDPTLKVSGLRYPHSYPLHLRSYLAADLSNRGDGLRALGKLEESTRDLLAAVHFDPQSGFIRTNLAVTLKHVPGRAAEAIQVFREAIRLEPSLPTPRNLLADLLYRNGRVDEAEAIVDETIRLFPHFSWIHLARGAFLADRGDWAGARESSERAIQADPSDGAAYYSLGFSLMNQRLSEEAVQSLQKSIQLDPTPLESYQLLARVLSRLGRFEEAQSVIRQGILFHPNDPILQQALTEASQALEEQRKEKERKK